MPVDVSSYPTAQPQAQDPLSQLGKIFQIQQAQVGLQMQQQEFKARQALGPILQQSIDPQTGELDINKFLVHGAANPDVAWKMPEITLQMIQRQNTQADTVVKQLEANKVRYGAMGDAAASLVTGAEEEASKRVNISTGQPGTPGISNKQLAASLSNMVGENGLIDSKDAADILTKTAGMTDQQRFDYAKRFATSAMGVKDTMEKTYGKLEAHGYGGGTAFTRPNQLAGTMPQVGNLTQTPTPSEMNATVAGVVPSGQPNAGAPTINPRVSVAPMVTGSGQQVPGSGQGSNVTGLSPMDNALQIARAKAANDYEEDLNGANLEAQNTVRIIDAMRDELKNFKSGGGAEVKQRLAAMVQALPGDHQNLVDKIAGGDYGSKQAFEKLATRLATAEMKTNLGASQKFTNLDFSTFMKKTQNLDTDPRALDKMFNYMDRSAWRLRQIQGAHQQAKHGNLPPGTTDISDFPSYAAKMMQMMNEQPNGR